MQINEYLKQVGKRIAAGNSTEHSYRTDLQNLLVSMIKGITVTNEPKRQKCGAPDYIITKNKIPVGYIEAKDVGADLDKVEKSEQMQRYLPSLDNLILTDYLEFRFYRSGKKVKSIRLAKIISNKLVPNPEEIPIFENHIKDFSDFRGITITSPENLAKMMAQKARLMEDIIFNAVKDTADENNTLKEQLKAFRDILIHDLDEKTFADIYAQTIAYGLFAARLNDNTLDTFSRQEARDLIAKSNPFLRNLFDYISGAQLDYRLVWIVNDLADIYRATDLRELLKNFGKSLAQTDPFIHFYETFLAEYDEKLRKSRGVYYTPEPVVNFIVRAVDDILKSEFGFAQGLADTSKVKLKTEVQGKKTEIDVHCVQILDPATGTGTFLAETIKQIHSKQHKQSGVWANYVEDHLLPRLHGFEILMAPYTMCHLKLDIMLKETGYKPKNENNPPRIGVYLTNSLEDAHKDTGTLFASWLSREAEEANHVKKKVPVMVVMGNPPYSGESSNKGEWIMKLMEDYKKEPGGVKKLDERNSKWINDDYVKFLRYGQHFIEKKGKGILAFINPHGYLDNPTFRGMRWNLLKTYDKIYTIDLHGNSKKKETSPDGSVDENVFDIMQGVSINLFIKTGNKKTNELGKIFHYDLFGKREKKYEFLFKNSIKSVSYKELPIVAPNYFFVGKEFKEQITYEKGFAVNELFTLNNVGIVTAKDAILVNNSKAELINIVEDYFKIKAENSLIHKLSYRPFDEKYIYYDLKLVERARYKLMQHFLSGNNLGLVIARQCVGEWQYVFISKLIGEFNLTGTAGRFGSGSYFPLYLYPEANGQQNISQVAKRTPNLNDHIVPYIASKLKLKFTPEKEETKGTFAPIDILDYIYAVLHNPIYRKKYNEFLKIDFPRIPYPDIKTFWKLVKLGSELRSIHLMEDPDLDKSITTYSVSGDNKVDKIKYEDSKIYINDKQYFGKVPEIAWNFFIGGYQPAQKWLKDRKEQELNYDDIKHYQKIIKVLSETDKIMKKIDEISL